MASVDEKQGHGRVLEFDKVTKSFAKTDSNEITHALAEVNLTIQPGEFVSIVGTSGCGKSTILRLIAGLIRPTTGEIRLGGKPIVGAGPDRGMVFQKATLFPWLTVEKNVSFSLRMQKKQDKELVEHMLKMVGLEDFRKDYPHQLSGGMRQRIVIAIALACDPELLICDEPTTALDVTIQAQVLYLLKELKKKYNLTVIFITHDLGVVANIADRVAVMYAGDIVELGMVEEIFYDPRHPYTWALLSSLPQLGVKGEELFSIQGTPPNLFTPVHGDAFAPRNPRALKIDFLERPPYFDVSPTHKARTWLLDPRAPKVEPPKIIQKLNSEGGAGA